MEEAIAGIDSAGRDSEGTDVDIGRDQDLPTEGVSYWFRFDRIGDVLPFSLQIVGCNLRLVLNLI